MKPQRVGRYRQRVQLFDVPETSRDSYGQPSLAGTQIVAPTTDGCFAAEIRMLRGDEILNVRQQWPTASDMVFLRWLGSSVPAGTSRAQGQIVERMYLIVVTQNNRRLNVLNADNAENRNRMWRLTCEEKRPN